MVGGGACVCVGGGGGVVTSHWTSMSCHGSNGLSFVHMCRTFNNCG